MPPVREPGYYPAKKRRTPRAPVSSGGGIAEVYQERQGGRSGAARRSQAAAISPGYTPRTPITPTPTSLGTRRVPAGTGTAMAARQRAVQRVQRQRARTVRRLIAKDPQKASQRLQRKVKTFTREINRDADTELKIPKVRLGDRTKVTKKTFKLGSETARNFLLDKPKAQAKVAKKLLDVQKPPPAKAPQQKAPPKKAPPRQKEALRKKLTKVAKRGKPSLIEQLDRPFGPEETIKPRHAALLLEAQGLPGRTYRQIIKGESAFRPGVPNPDDATPSLIQATPSVQSAETVAKWNAIARRHKGGYTNPVAAAEMAKVLAGDTTGVSNYYGTGFVRDFNAHLPGGPAKAQKALYGDPKPIPKDLKRKAKQVLGKGETRKVIKQARAVPVSTAAKPPPKKELKRWVQLTESPAEQGAEQGVKAKKAYDVTVGHMVPEMQRALVKLGKQTGIPVRINEGYRTTKRAEEFPSGTASHHHLGLAADVDNHGDYTAEQLAKAGLNNTTVSGEPWHFELNSAPTTTSSPVSGTGVPTVGAASSAAVTAAPARTPSSRSGRSSRRRARRKSENARRQAVIRKLIAEGPVVSPTVTPTETELREEEISLGL